MNKKQLFFIVNLLLSTSLSLSMDENTTPSNSVILKSALKQHQSPRKNNPVNFSSRAAVVLIAHVKDYHQAGLTSHVWYSPKEAEAIKKHINILKSTSNEAINNLAITDLEKEQLKEEKSIVENIHNQKTSPQEKALHIDNTFRQIEEREYLDRQKKEAKNLIERFLGIQF